jgi:hypothetical protein
VREPDALARPQACGFFLTLSLNVAATRRRDSRTFENDERLLWVGVSRKHQPHFVTSCAR